MVVGLHGILGVYVHKYVANLFDHVHELVTILNRKIMVEYVLDLNVKKNHVQK
jgi:hypothetical protein